MAFTQRQNRLTTYFSERIPVVKRRMSVPVDIYPYTYIYTHTYIYTRTHIRL